ncbi:hypothetical protein FA15DRAFT_667047 [Coprinopsis marcescibilis]|uniref:Uncharacterized protein n=1 Tax=Coprinopsis marcescibilis TaxID=230819 RepID=A0A5C3L1U4_COPMA|nr:hypothetical protein FA15DRAFT_667047 [Coprinopsis marcescibilis]
MAWSLSLSGTGDAGQAPSVCWTRQVLAVAAPISWTLATVAQIYVLIHPGLGPQSANGPQDEMVFGLTVLVGLLGGLWFGAEYLPAEHRSLTPPRQHSRRIAPEEQPLLCSAEGGATGILDEKNAVSQIPSRYGNTLGGQYPVDRGVSAPSAYLPYFVAGNACVVAWSALWYYGYTILAQFPLVMNLVIQNYSIFILLHSWRRVEFRVNRFNFFTHLLSKSNAALIVLLLWKNSGILDRAAPPTILEMLNNAVIFVLMAIGAGPDPTLAIFLLHDLAALALGTSQDDLWRVAFEYTGLCVIFVMAWDISGAWGIEALEEDDEFDEEDHRLRLV